MALKSWAEQQRSLISGKTPLKMCHLTRHGTGSKGEKELSKKGEQTTHLEALCAKEWHAAKEPKKGSAVPLRLSVGRGTGDQKDTHVFDDCFCTICIRVGKS